MNNEYSYPIDNNQDQQAFGNQNQPQIFNVQPVNKKPPYSAFLVPVAVGAGAVALINIIRTVLSIVQLRVMAIGVFAVLSSVLNIVFIVATVFSLIAYIFAVKNYNKKCQDQSELKIPFVFFAVPALAYMFNSVTGFFFGIFEGLINIMMHGDPTDIYIISAIGSIFSQIIFVAAAVVISYIVLKKYLRK